MKYSEVERKLVKAGCYYLKDGKKHPIWFSPITGEQFPVGRHTKEEVPKGTLKSIREAAGLK